MCVKLRLKKIVDDYISVTLERKSWRFSLERETNKTEDNEVCDSVCVTVERH